MAFQVVCISRSLGAGGEEIGRRVAEALGFRFADEEIIVKAAREAGVTPEIVAQAEQSRPLIARVLEAMGTTPAEPGGWVPGVPFPQTNYEALIKEVVLETASAGRVVIVAHGGSIGLQGMDGLLRVFVTASPRIRAQRLCESAGLDQSAAEKAVADSDRERKEYLRRFYKVREELGTHYDLVVNTDLFPLERAAELIANAAGG